MEESTQTKMPKYVENVFKNLNKKTTQAEVLFVLNYCLALESGFYPSNSIDDKYKISSLYSYDSRNVCEISKQGFPKPIHCVDEDFYRLELKYPLQKIKDDVSNEKLNITTSLISAVKSSDFLIITMTVNDFPGKSICLPLSRYILSTTKKDISYRLRNMKELSIIVKDEIFVPLRNLLINEYSSGTLVYPGIQGLPYDVLEFLVRFVKSLKDLQNLSKTCKRLREVCKTEKTKRLKI